jgi:hypothetical protein
MNLQEEIKDLIKGVGRQEVEFKAVLPPSQNIARNIAAFANAKGGYIILGVIEKNRQVTIKGLSGDFRATEITHKALDLLTPRPIVDYDYVIIDGKRLFVIKVSKDKDVLIEGKKYIRDGFLTKLIDIVEVPLLKKAKSYDKINELFKKYQTLNEIGTSAKEKFINHYLSILRIIDDLGKILYPDKPEIPTTNQEGKILCRILYSSAMDNFETYLSDILYEIFLAKPQTLKSKQVVTIKEVLDCSSIQDFIEYWAKQKIGKLQKGSVTGFIEENKQINDLGIINKEEQKEIEKLLQIRHLYSHRNGIVDEKFLRFFRGLFIVNTEHQIPISEICTKLDYLVDIVDKLDNAAINRYNLDS